MKKTFFTICGVTVASIPGSLPFIDHFVSSEKVISFNLARFLICTWVGLCLAFLCFVALGLFAYAKWKENKDFRDDRNRPAFASGGGINTSRWD
jgi:hypothetical protein